PVGEPEPKRLDRPADALFEQFPLAPVKRLENVVAEVVALPGIVLAAHSHPQARELVRSEPLDHRPHSALSPGGTPGPHPQDPQSQVDVVEADAEVFGTDAILFANSLNGLSEGAQERMQTREYDALSASW